MCCWSAVICAIDCSAYKLFMPMPPFSAGPYTTDLILLLFGYIPFLAKIPSLPCFQSCLTLFLLGKLRPLGRLLPGCRWHSMLPLLVFVLYAQLRLLCLLLRSSDLFAFLSLCIPCYGLVYSECAVRCGAVQVFDFRWLLLSFFMDYDFYAAVLELLLGCVGWYPFFVKLPSANCHRRI